MPSNRDLRRPWLTWIVVLLGVAAIAAVAYDGHRAVRSSHRPFDIDQFRDVAAAQSLADGQLLRDPFYAHETI